MNKHKRILFIIVMIIILIIALKFGYSYGLFKYDKVIIIKSSSNLSYYLQNPEF